jgi:hypothetical protein
MGRPSGRKGRPLQLYATDEFIALVDDWRRRQPDIPNRSEAIRRMAELGSQAEFKKR